MQIPLELSFHGVTRSEWSEAYIREHVERLERFCDNITSCRVTVEQPHHHQHQGNPYRVRVEVRLPPNKDLVATEEPAQVAKDSHLQPVILSAFKMIERQLKDTVERRRSHLHPPVPEEPRALAVRLFREEGYGFIRTPEGSELYFHRNSVLHDDFDRVAIGTEVRYVAGMGEMGLQASSVQIVNKPGVRESEDASGRPDIPPGWENA